MPSPFHIRIAPATGVACPAADFRNYCLQTGPLPLPARPVTG